MHRDIYLDNSATTRAFDEVLEYMDHINRSVYGNPSSLHIKGLEAEKLLKKARETIAVLLNADLKEFYFTSGGTESNNLAIRGYLEWNPRKGRHIIASAIEHPSVLEVFNHLSKNGYAIDFIGTDNEGIIDTDMLKEKIRSDTALISIMHTNNETGAVQPIEKVANIRNTLNRQVAIHVDAVQAFGKAAINPKKLGIEMMSISSHKIHGPKGAGGLYVNKDIRIKPIILGGGQEGALRSGTENLPGICGFGLASEIAYSQISQNREIMSELKEMLITGIKQSVEDYEIVSPETSSPYILNVSFHGVQSEVLLHHLEERHIYISTGSACSSRKNIHSHVLKAMNLHKSCIQGAVRFSFSSMNTEEDILQTIDALKEIVPRIRVKRR